MNNMFRNFSPDIKYDLKGSSLGRTTTFKDGKRDATIALKDNDFLDDNRVVDINQEDKEQLQSILRKDSEYLGNNATLDYSLLLGVVDLEKLREKHKDKPEAFDNDDPVLQLLKGNSKIKDRGIYVSSNEKEVYVIGIIDTLTNYTTMKKMEYYYKRCQHGHEMS
jgi:1-phosphatidylinositol-4-phosphate 5-kinase